MWNQVLGAEDHPATRASHGAPESPIQVEVPGDWLFGASLTLATLFFSIIWWVRGLSARVEANSKDVQSIMAKCIREHDVQDNAAANFKHELESQVSKEITQSAATVCHGFEIFAVEIRAGLQRINEKLEERSEDITNLKHGQDKQVKAITSISDRLAILKEQTDRQGAEIRAWSPVVSEYKRRMQD